eukprot:CAMPEP_0118937084 /NCGR_PEP_ID=MMETSP1169-20130426/21560_1 /TAXON_ID=36882 /ORGANISM="Pyramimonas obovata, Strain CCMP722" /LENGTH=53 /DNA_ID=CAMNT_0006880609 /DNA_START=28 /DNA_END=186 /DNA_ORIENTATION=-
MGDDNDLCQYSDFADLPRRDLQQLAKAHGIKANGKSADIVKALEQVRDAQIES